jgi:hypothetical protein
MAQIKPSSNPRQRTGARRKRQKRAEVRAKRAEENRKAMEEAEAQAAPPQNLLEGGDKETRKSNVSPARANKAASNGGL